MAITVGQVRSRQIRQPLGRLSHQRQAHPTGLSSITARRRLHASIVQNVPRPIACKAAEGDGSGESSNDAAPCTRGICEIDTPFNRILCANRGEIAIRVFRAGTEAGLQTVAIYSPADRLQPHRYKADESYEVGTPDMQPVACYLDVEAIVACAKENEVDVIHPGYGFLSENAKFARRCAEEGITFVGPRPETIEAMGDKVTARALATECGVPVVPGTNEPVTSVEAAREFSNKAGYPVMLKAAMGGGGRGMRVVRSEEELGEAFLRASGEAKSAFGDGRMFIEKYVEDPRHIEIQILADTFGNVIHLYERDCSVQRRHQKVVELAPSPSLDENVRQSLFNDAVKLAKHVGYCNAGTVEFMVDKSGNYYFLEVNPRIQVEHTVTEEITGVDLVQSQIRIAGGASLADLGMGSQEEVAPPIGCAIQCRVTSEDPELNFKPDTGRLEAYRVPGGPGIRLDGAVSTGNLVSRYYDSLLAKVISHAPTFATSVQKMQRALREFQVRGLKTNLPFLENVLQHPEFLSGCATTSFIERNSKDLFLFEPTTQLEAARILGYLGDMVVNGADHPGAVGGPPSRIDPSPILVPEGLDLKPATNWKKIIDQEGPEAWAKAVRGHKGVLLTDTTWRDAHQSLLATRMRTYDLLKAAPATAQILKNAASLECWGGATFDVAMRFLHEDPWKRLEQLRKKVPDIPFQMLLRGANAVGYTSYSDNVVREFCREAVVCGVDIFRVFDSLNYLDNLKFGMDAVREAGGVVEGTICYTGDASSPDETKYTLDYYLAMAEEIVNHGTHSIAIKDMAGLMKPSAAKLLVSALREQFPEVPIHVHTHDSAGTGVATQLASAMAGADIVDCCIDTMSGMTSQPSMGAIVNSLAGTELDTGIDPAHLGPLALFWEETRELYSPFESSLKSTNSEVYRHEMPGGQYTNLKFQATSLGLGNEWHRVVDSFAAANRVLGNIVKVTPSSKVVGDLAQFMVQNDLDEVSVVEKAESLSFPNSVVEFCQGYIGFPPGGVPEPFCSRVLRGRKKEKKGAMFCGNILQVDGRPGAAMPALNLAELEARLKEKHGSSRIKKRDVLSAALYPQVFENLMSFQIKYGEHIEDLPTRAFLAPMEEDDEIEMKIGVGKSLTVKYKAKGELQPNGKREVFFETRGVPRVIEVDDRSEASAALKTGVRDRADPNVLGSVGAPMAGDVVDVLVKPGTAVTAGQQLVILSAMKMETAVCAPVGGSVQHVAADKGDLVDAGDLLVLINESTTGNGGSETQPAEAASAVASA